MTAAIEHYDTVLEDSPFDDEALTVLVVTGATEQEVADALGVDLGADPTEYPDAEDEQRSAYAIAEIDGGVVAVETSGYADPTLDALRALSRGGRDAAVVRDNIQAHVRFGWARDGEIVFDDDEYWFLDDPESVPAELRPHFDTVWVDPDGDGDESETSPLVAGLAMVEVATGLRLTVEDLERVAGAGYRSAPSLVYVPSD